MRASSFGICAKHEGVGLMVLIFGGVYQGKLAYAKKRFGDGKKIVDYVDREVLAWIQSGESLPEKMLEFISANADSVVICNDISCGVVPIDPIMRKWREEVGHFMSLLAENSDEVIRMFCGIPTQLK